MSGPTAEQIAQAAECLEKVLDVPEPQAREWAPELAQMWLDRQAELLPTPLGLQQ